MDAGFSHRTLDHRPVRPRDRALTCRCQPAVTAHRGSPRHPAADGAGASTSPQARLPATVAAAGAYGPPRARSSCKGVRAPRASSARPATPLSVFKRRESNRRDVRDFSFEQGWMTRKDPRPCDRFGWTSLQGEGCLTWLAGGEGRAAAVPAPPGPASHRDSCRTQRWGQCRGCGPRAPNRSECSHV